MNDSQEELNKMHWRDRYDLESARELETLIHLSETQLIKSVQDRQLGDYYNLWQAIVRNGSLENAWYPLWDFLQQYPGDQNTLHRVHCSEALFTLMGYPDPDYENELRKQVMWDNDGEESRQQALLELKELIEELLET